MTAAIYARKSTEQTGVADEQKSVARQIEAGWHAWFVRAHTQRLRENDLDEATFIREHTAIVALADAITQRMRSDYLARRPQWI